MKLHLFDDGIFAYRPDIGTWTRASDAEIAAAAPRIIRERATALNACQAVVDNWEAGDLAAAARQCAFALKYDGTWATAPRTLKKSIPFIGEPKGEA